MSRSRRSQAKIRQVDSPDLELADTAAQTELPERKLLSFMSLRELKRLPRSRYGTFPSMVPMMSMP